MRIIIRVLLVFSLLVPSVFAGHHYELENTERSPFYYGVGLGFGLLRSEASLYRDAALINTIYDRSMWPDYSLRLYTGYGKSFSEYFNNRFYFGSEVTLTASPINQRATGTVCDKNINLPYESGGVGCSTDINTDIDHNLQIYIKQPLTAAIDIMPGVFSQEKNALFYARLGLGVNWLYFKLTDIFDGNSVRDSTSRYRYTYRLGFGGEYFIDKKYSIRLEYVYTGILGNNDLIKHVFDAKVSKFVPGTIWDCTYASTNAYQHLYGLGNRHIHAINLSVSIY